MKFILDAATILGGIAALWFFWDRIAAYRNRVRSKASVEIRSQRRAIVSNNGREQWRIWGCTFGAFFGGLGWFTAEQLNVYAFPITFLLTIVAIAVTTPDSLGKLVNPDSEDKIVAAVGLGVASSLYTSIVGIITYFIVGSIGGMLAGTLGAIAGTIYGYFSLNIEKPYML